MGGRLWRAAGDGKWTDEYLRGRQIWAEVNFRVAAEGLLGDAAAMELFVTDLQAVLVARSAFRWPTHGGSLLRGMIGRALRQSGCARGKAACEEACEAPATCLYARLFEPPPRDPPPHRLLASAERPPAPFVLQIPRPGARDLAPGDRVEVGVRLLGQRSVDEIGAVNAALEGIADLPVGTDAGAWTLGEIRQVGTRNKALAVAADGAGATRLHIEFETPAWIEAKGRVTPDLDAVTLFRAVARRITVVCALYGELAPDHDPTFAALDTVAAHAQIERRQLRAVRWERLSVERDARHPMRGLVGSLDLTGEVGALLPWLRWGEIVHVGKATSYGLGRMTVVAT